MPLPLQLRVFLPLYNCVFFSLSPGGIADLSLLARGTGLLGGGVEVECFGEDRRAFTLNGEPFIKPSKSPEGQYAKPYRWCQLTLPKTYITRRGQMVLFTSPEDMVIGQSVALQHRKEITSETAATRLKTVNKLVSSSLGYEPNKVRDICVEYVLTVSCPAPSSCGSAFEVFCCVVLLCLSLYKCLSTHDVHTSVQQCTWYML
jgi:hypothetical protein